jgi:hypothetical protein
MNKIDLFAVFGNCYLETLKTDAYENTSYFSDTSPIPRISFWSAISMGHVL